MTSLADLSEPWAECLVLAWEAQRSGSLPIAAVVVADDGRVLGRGRNRVAERHERSPHLPATPYLTGTPLAHAEVNALLEMGYRPPGGRPTLYTTTEPCPLCMGAARMAGVGRVVYASRDVWAGAACMAESVPYLQRMGPKVSGPMSSLEAPLLAWQAAVHLDIYRHSPEFLDRWEESFPDAVNAGKRLHADGVLRKLALGGADMEAVWLALNESLR